MFFNELFLYIFSIEMVFYLFKIILYRFILYNVMFIFILIICINLLWKFIVFFFIYCLLVESSVMERKFVGFDDDFNYD